MSPAEKWPLLLNYRSQLISGWGRFPASRAAVARPERQFEVAQAFQNLRGSPTDTLIARGSGLAYGDAALNSGGRVISMSRLNRFLEFDAANGLITCEAGVTIGEVLDVCMPRAWCLAVVPGTPHATVGGSLACDVHGKNHRLVGSFSQHVAAAKVLVASGDVVTCGPDRRQDLFWATAGGMGLTGIILELTLRLQRIETSYVRARNIPADNLEAIYRKLEETSSATYSVVWLDGVARGTRLGRGIVMVGEHAASSDLPAERRADPLAMAKKRSNRSIPLTVPAAALARPLAGAVNDFVYRRFATSEGPPRLVEASRYFFPLELLGSWNRLFGRSGFVEYQVVLPLHTAFDGIKQMLEMLHRADAVSFMTSIKPLGESSSGYLSFPMPGYAFSFTQGAADKNMLSLLARCDELTASLGGRIYLAKDARAGADTFARMYARRDEWRNIVRRYDPNGLLTSDLGRRLDLV